MSQTRRLAAILAADVAGYSRLMGEDEEDTLAALKAIRRELADPKIKEHHGRIVKTTGDGLLGQLVRLSFAREETRESRGMPCLFLNTERVLGGPWRDADCGRTRRRCARPPGGAIGRQSPSYRRAGLT